jgi:Zn-dependent peptidase ImmA (M78 family)
MTKEEKEIHDRHEYEANVFAVCLLIPRDELIKDLENTSDEKSEDLKRLCKKYGVSTTAMAFRLSILNKNKK